MRSIKRGKRQLFNPDIQGSTSSSSYQSTLDTSLFQGDGGSCVSGGEQAGPVPRPAGTRGRGPLPGPGEPLPLPGGLGGRELPGHRKPLHAAHPAGDGAPEVPSRPTTLQRLQVHGQTHQQRVWQEEEVGVMVNREVSG